MTASDQNIHAQPAWISNWVISISIWVAPPSNGFGPLTDSFMPYINARLNSWLLPTGMVIPAVTWSCIMNNKIGIQTQNKARPADQVSNEMNIGCSVINTNIYIYIYTHVYIIETETERDREIEGERGIYIEKERQRERDRERER